MENFIRRSEWLLQIYADETERDSLSSRLLYLSEIEQKRVEERFKDNLIYATAPSI